MGRSGLSSNRRQESRRKIHRHSTALLGSIGLLLLAAGLLLLAFLPQHPSIPDIIWRMALCGIGFGCFQSPNNRTLITADEDRWPGQAHELLERIAAPAALVPAGREALIFDWLAARL